MDAPWLEVVDYLKAVSDQGIGVAAQEQFRAILPSVISYGDIESHEPEFFHALVIHKGLYQQIDPSFLNEFLSRAKPTFANEVFIVLRTHGTALKSRNAHIGTLREIAQWAARQADPWARRVAKEPPLSSDVVLARMADFIVRNLAKPVDPARPDSPLAIAETAERFNDTAWFWADDSGKTAELFAVPQLRDAYPQLADAALDHVLRLSPDRIIQRRSAVAELKLVDANPEDFRAYNSFFNLTGNLKAGIVRPSIRFNDGRTRFLADYSGNVLRFRYRGRLQAVDVEDAISEWRIEERPDRIVFSHMSAIEARPLIGWRQHVCNVTYRYSLWKGRPAIELEAEITTLPGVALDSVQLSTAFDQLTASCAFDTVTAGQSGQYQRYSPPAEPVARLHTGPADYLGIGEMGYIPGFSHGLHVRLRNAAELCDVVAEGSQPGLFHWIYLRYALGRIEPEKTRTIVEDRLLTGGGHYSEPDIYTRVMDSMSTATDNVDPSMSYDIGAELNAVAVTILLAKNGRYRTPPNSERLAALKTWYDRHLNIFLEAHRLGDAGGGRVVFIRGLSFVILSLDCMLRTFGSDEYRNLLLTCVEHLLGLERSVEGERDATIFSVPQPPEFDCHASALLALARASVHGDPQDRIGAALRRALRGTLILQVSAEEYGHPNLTIESLWVRSTAGGPPQDGGFWVFKLGLALRAFNAIQQVNAAGFVSLDRETLAKIDKLTQVGRLALMHALRREDDTIEVLTSQCSGETNSETQPWAALGLVPAIEWELYGRPAETDIQLSMAIEPAAALSTPSVNVNVNGMFNRMAPSLQVEWEVAGSTLDRLTARIAATWKELGETKPHWSVLSGDEYLPLRIAETEEQFFASGKVDRDWLLATLARAGRKPADFATVLEYGSGLGRVTNHLAESFPRIIARDISEPHLVRALARSAAVGLTNIDYGLARPPEFGMMDPFALWFSFLVLQHNPPPVMALVLRRALKLLQPGGFAVFQIPTWARHYRFEVDSYLQSAPPVGSFELHCLPQPVVFALAQEAGCRVMEVFEDSSVGHPDWVSNVIVLSKPR